MLGDKAVIWRLGGYRAAAIVVVACLVSMSWQQR